MTKIKAFKGFRPLPEIAQQVASRPYDVSNRQETKAAAEGNPYSFFNVIRAEINFPDSLSPYDEQVYQQAKNNFNKLVAEGVFVQDNSDCLYIYAQTMNGRQQIGLVTGTSIDDYQNDVIKKHEYTRPAKEQDRINHITTTRLHTGPVLMAYPQVADIDDVVNEIIATPSTYDFTASDGIQHTFWVVRNEETVAELVRLFAETVPAIYIADGHHRAASSTKVGLACRTANEQHTGEEEYNFFLSVLFPDNQLAIMDYNRVVRDLNGLDVATFLEKIQADFEVKPYTDGAFKPQKKHEFGLYLHGKWYCLTAKAHTHHADHPIKSLDIAILSDYLIAPVLGITDQRRDERIDFVGGIRGLGELEKRVDSGEMKLAFSIYPVSIQQLLAVADSGEVMPPKSTWFEPKLRSGLVVHQF